MASFALSEYFRSEIFERQLHSYRILRRARSHLIDTFEQILKYYQVIFNHVYRTLQSLLEQLYEEGRLQFEILHL
jgi:hypothetical protein